VQNASFADSFIYREDVEEESRKSRKRILDQIRALDLVERAWELEVDGFTVLNPDEAATRKITKRLTQAALAVAEDGLGHPVDLANGSDQAAIKSPFGQVQTEIGVLGEDRAFEEALVNPSALALLTYLLGESLVLIHQSVYVKGPGPDHLPFHTDQDQVSSPSPFMAFAQVANATWALTDYTVENGATCFAPGSHRLCRAPTRYEATDLRLFTPVEAEAGSIIVWHGNTWHGALRRTAPGLRISLVEFFGRWYFTGTNASSITEEMLQRNPPQFARLVRSRPTGKDLGSVKVQAAKETLYA
jgi:hypothetical protein